MKLSPKLSIAALAPGILVAATGVGAGDLATATLSGAKLGVAVLWAVVFGAALKYVLNEGLTRWQLVTGKSLIEGAVQHVGKPAAWLFLAYLLGWTFLVALALMSACGVAGHAILPIFENASHDKILYGILHSLAAVVLVFAGGFKLFEKVMSVSIGVMFFVVVLTAFLLAPPFGEILQGLTIPRIPDFQGEGLSWTLGLLGGVGGTVTVLCYGYWIREGGRTQSSDLALCRVDLAVGYIVTAVFGVAMVIIGSQVEGLEGKGALLVVQLAETLETELGQAGPIGRWAFLIGAWGALFSSLLGVWQSVPYLFSELCENLRRSGKENESSSQSDRTQGDIAQSGSYRLTLVLLATIPMLGLLTVDFARAMKIYAVVGAFFIPILTAVLLVLNSGRFIGNEHKNKPLTVVVLAFTLAVFCFAGALQIQQFFTN